MTAKINSSATSGTAADLRWRQLVAPPDYENPIPKSRYHLVVVGAGPAGLIISIAAAGLGAHVALVEKNRMGGDCLNVGCVPSKALLEATRTQGASFASAFTSMRTVRADISAHDSVERYTNAGVDVFLGSASFVDEANVAVGDQILHARRVVIATGARASVPPIPGLRHARPLTNESVFDLTEQPKTLAVIGGGPIGCELAQVFARLGTEVHLFEAADRILGNEAREAAAVVQKSLHEAGIHLHLNTAISEVERRGSLVFLTSDEGTVSTDQLLVAAGRRANTEDLNLAGVGVETTETGQISVDPHLRTSNPRIYAAGDVCSRLQFTHHADAQARIVVQNALFFATAKTSKLIVPRCTYTSPELAQVGPTAAELATKNMAFDTYRIDYSELDRGRTQGDTDGFIEVLTEFGGGQILGATIVGEDAGEQIAAIVLCMAHDLGIDAFGKAIFPYPTRAEALKRLADQFQRKKLTPRTRALFGRWFRWTA
jgi:pyruvate/2-oxoglutarate dehydrogenase complex dihydrolipoamide dehydrogenase (E3) component